MTYYENHKEERHKYYIENKEDRLEYMKDYYVENKAERLEYAKKYYAEKKEKIVKRRKEILTCECGAKIMRMNMSGHRKTQRHQRALTEGVLCLKGDTSP